MRAVFPDLSEIEATPAVARRLVPAAVVGALLLLYLGVGIRDHGLWSPTEPAVAGVVWNMSNGSSLAVPRINEMAYLEKPPLYYWLSLLSVKAFGLSAPALRLPSALLGLGALLALGVAVRRRYDGDVALVAVGIVASLPWFWVVSHRATPDAGVLFFSFVAYSVFLLGLDEAPATPRRILDYDLALGALVGLSFLVKNLFVPFVVLLPVTLTLLVLRRWKSIAKVLGAFGAFLVLAALPWALAIHAEGGWPFVQVAFLDNTVGRFLNLARTVEIDPVIMNDARVVGRHGPFYYVLPLMAITLPWSRLVLPSLWRAMWSFRRSALRTFLAVGFASGFLSLSLASSKSVEYVLPLCFFLGLAAAEWLRGKAWPEERRTGLILTHARLLCALLAVAPALHLALTRTPQALLATVLAVGLFVTSLRLPRERAFLPLAVALVALSETAAFGAAVSEADREKTSQPFFADVLHEASGRETVTALREDRRLPLMNFYLRRRVTVLPDEETVLSALSGAKPVAAIVPAGFEEGHGHLLRKLRLRRIGAGTGRDDLVCLLNLPPMAADAPHLGP